VNKELYDKANKELDILLEKCPELLALQAEISYNLAMMDNKLERVYYTQELMLDKLDELREAMEAVNASNN
jgi:hypothetical protein